MHIKIIATGIFAVLMANHALADAPRAVPIYLSENGHILTDAMVNGEGPYTFILDTAAGGTVVFEDFAESAGFDPIRGGEQIQVHGASGIMEASLVEVGDVQMGEWSFTLDQAIVIPAPEDDHIMGEGIIGFGQLLAQPVGFALADGQLDIFERDQAIDADAELEGEWFSTPIELRMGGFVWTNVIIDGVPFDAVIDTGARRSTINPAGAQALGIDLETADLVEDEPIRGATSHPTPSWTLPVSTVQMGDRVWGGRNLTVSDIAIFSAMGRQDVPTIIFGADMLVEQNFVIDPVANVIWMEKRQSAALGYLVRPETELSSAVH